MVDFFSKYELMHGFLNGRACLTNTFFEEVTKWVDEGSPVDNNLLGFRESI